MKNFTNVQRATIIIGASGIIINVIALAIDNVALGYGAMFLARLAGTLFMVALDKLNPIYFLPLTLSALNAGIASESLLFLELITSSCIYQVNAYKVFSNQQSTK
jgi:hypothetical protein